MNDQIQFPGLPLRRGTYINFFYVYCYSGIPLTCMSTSARDIKMNVTKRYVVHLLSYMVKQLCNKYPYEERLAKPVILSYNMFLQKRVT